MKKVKVGFFDSGHGGLSLLISCQKLLPAVEFHYIADCAFHPYGSKTESEVKERSLYLVNQLISRGCETIVVACNTATAIAIDTLREMFPKKRFVGIEPYLNIITKKTFSDNESLGVLVTPRTLESYRFQALKKRVDTANRLDVVGLPLLAPYIEDCIVKQKMIDLNELEISLGSAVEKTWSHVILGCTHYPLIRHKIAKILKAECIDPSCEVALQLERLMDANDQLSLGSCNDAFWFSNTHFDDWEMKSSDDFLKCLTP